MTQTAHTPGPWRAGASTFYPGLDGPLTMRVYTDHPPTEFEVTGDNIAANARLIAAAPDLLDALQAIVDEFPVAAGTAKGIPHDEQGFGSIYRARAAIARATGEKQ